jgi:hypothetical protein
MEKIPLPGFAEVSLLPKGEKITPFFPSPLRVRLWSAYGEKQSISNSLTADC